MAVRQRRKRPAKAKVPSDVVIDLGPLRDAYNRHLRPRVEQLIATWPQIRANAIANWESLQADVVAYDQLKTFAATVDVRAAPRLSILLDAFVERLQDLAWNETPSLAALTKVERRDAATAGVAGYKSKKAAVAREGKQRARDDFKNRTRAEWATGKYGSRKECARHMERVFQAEVAAWTSGRLQGKPPDSVPKYVRKAILARRNRIPEFDTIVKYLENQ